MVFTILYVLLTSDVKQCYIEANRERMGDIMIYRSLKESGLVSGIFIVAAAALATDFLFNFQGSQVCAPGSYHQPTDINEVSSIVKKAYGLGTKVMTGSEKFASQIDAACTDAGGVQISLAQIDHIHVNREMQTVTVGAGVRFAKVIEALAEEGLAINHVTELNSFTIGGMLGSGTHGSSLQKAAATMSDYLLSLVVVDGTGKQVKVTGEDLNAFRVNLGVLGVVVEATFQAEPLFKVTASRYYDSDENLENKILDLANDNYSLNLSWFPGIGKFAALIFNPVGVDQVGDAHNGQAEITDVELMGFKLLFDNLAHRDTMASCTVATARYQSRINNFFKNYDGSTALEQQGTLPGGEIVKQNIGYSHKMQYFGCRDDGLCVWDEMPIQLQEIAIAFEDLPSLMKDIRKVLLKKPACFPLNGVYMRFVPSSKSLIGMNSGRKTAFVGIEFVLNKKGKPPLNYDVQQEIEQLLLKKYSGRPHWGKNTVPLFIGIGKNYDAVKWQKFLDTKDRFDPKGIFTNQFWRRIISKKNSELLKTLMSDGCVAKGLCYCSSDNHCDTNNGERCGAGRFFKEAFICRKD